MDSARRGHETIGFAETDDTAVTGTTQEEKVCAVRPGIVSRLDSLILVDLVPF
jgi:hypothetical protein